ncbi:respiratory nitrate reductase subunit gamma [Ancrocorticia populi]|uniref:Nitrate reductase-like protein NarX n=1 Tax=Ancrocorticia populi TaxID=2175228 RepID=A0A2V1K852_9ACTO|nr:respiratory nitrate reductase subunit gamma [Ancrocorticia populi]PWF27648.1 respiratory nitrate reductase subunit gamma [Ancrocorticia populi]
MSTLDIALWGVFPYVALTVFIVGIVWRWKTDQFGWTSRSSQLHESKILRWGSPLFHVGIIFVFLGHVLGVLIPKSWTEAVGVSQHTYHLVATGAGAVAAVMAIAGFVLLMIRRFKYPSVRRKTTRNDKVMLLPLTIPLLLGAFATFHHQVFGEEGGYDYRETISPWLRSIFTLNPKIDLMLGAPLDFQLHVIAGILLIAIIPYTRLVHMFSAPIGYVTRPYIVYRSRDAAVSTRDRARGWSPVGEGTVNGDPSEGA